MLTSLKAPEVGQVNRSCLDRTFGVSVRSHMVADVQSEARLRVFGSAYDTIAQQHLPDSPSNISPSHSINIMTDCELASMFADALDDFVEVGGRCSTSCSVIADENIIHPSIVTSLVITSNHWFYNTQLSATDDRAHPSGDLVKPTAATHTESRALYGTELGAVGMAAIGMAPPALASDHIMNDTRISESLANTGLTEGDTVRDTGPEPVPPALQRPTLVNALQTPVEQALWYSHTLYLPSIPICCWRHWPLQLVNSQLSLPSLYSTQLARSYLNSLGLVGTPSMLQSDVLWHHFLQQVDVFSSPLHSGAQLHSLRVGAEHSKADQIRSELNRAEQIRSEQSSAEGKGAEQTHYSTQLSITFNNRRDSATGFLNAEWGGGGTSSCSSISTSSRPWNNPLSRNIKSRL